MQLYLAIKSVCIPLNYIANITNLLVSTVARNSMNFNLVCQLYGYIRDVTMTLYAPSIEMYTRITVYIYTQ